MQILRQVRVRLRRIPPPTLRLPKPPNLQRTELQPARRKTQLSPRSLQRRLSRSPPVQKSSLRLLLRIRSRHQRQLPAHQGIHPQLHRKRHHRPRRSKMPQRSPMHLKREAPRRQRQVRWMPTRHGSRSRCFLPWRHKGKRLRQQRSPRPICSPNRNWLQVRCNLSAKKKPPAGGFFFAFVLVMNDRQLAAPRPAFSPALLSPTYRRGRRSAPSARRRRG